MSWLPALISLCFRAALTSRLLLFPLSLPSTMNDASSQIVAQTSSSSLSSSTRYFASPTSKSHTRYLWQSLRKLFAKAKVKGALPLPCFTNSHYCNLTCVHKRARQATRNSFFPENFPEFFKGSSTTSCKRKKKSRTFALLPTILCDVVKVPFPDQGWRFTVIVSTDCSAAWDGGWGGERWEVGVRVNV